MTLRNFLPLFAAGLLFTACGNENNEEQAGTAVDSVKALEMVSVTGSPDFPDARLTISKVTAAPQGDDSVRLSFAFDVQHYELKSQTADANSKQCNNSAQGQHIHFILDNKPYTALYEPKHEVTVAKNTEHYLLVFLSRSYHESIKQQGAAALYHFNVDDKGKLTEMPQPAEPMVFYSRPKGDYIGADTENLLFDFYIWNAALGAGGYTLKAQVKGNGLDTTMNINTWQPYFLKNMPMGKASIKLTLLDNSGNKVNSPESEVTREFTLSADEPLPPAQ